jgi:hypothetical protein
MMEKDSIVLVCCCVAEIPKSVVCDEYSLCTL